MVVAKAVRNSQTGSGKKGDSTQTGKRASGKGAPAKRQSRNAQAKQRAQARSGQKQGFKLGRFLRDVRVELSKVTWPTRAELIQSTIVVLVFVAIAAAYTGALDFVFQRVVNFILPK
jgi:preprotein translocase subunit SecE